MRLSDGESLSMNSKAAACVECAYGKAIFVAAANIFDICTAEPQRQWSKEPIDEEQYEV